MGQGSVVGCSLEKLCNLHAGLETLNPKPSWELCFFVIGLSGCGVWCFRRVLVQTQSSAEPPHNHVRENFDSQYLTSKLFGFL